MYLFLNDRKYASVISLKSTFLQALLILWYSLNTRMFSLCWHVSVLMTSADGAGSASTNTPGLTGLTKYVGDAIVDEEGCAVSTIYPTVPLPRLQCTDAAHAFRKPFTSVIYVCVGTTSSGAIVYSGNVDNIDSIEVVILSCFCLEILSVQMLIFSNDC